MINKFSLIMLVVTLLFAGCKNEGDKNFYGNFQSDEMVLPSTGTGKLQKLIAEEGVICNEGDLLAVIDTTILSLERSKVKSSLKALQEMGMFSQMEPLQYELRILEERIRLCYIKAPVRARVIKINFRQGEYLFEGSPILSVADVNRIYFVAWVPGSDISSVSAGDSVRIQYYMNDDSAIIYKGRVLNISERPQFIPSMVQTRGNRTDQHYKVKVEVSNNGTLKSGMPGELVF